MWTRALLAALGLALAGAPSVQGREQSLAEAARKERERREALRSSSEQEARTLTDRDLARAKGRVANPSAGAGAEPDGEPEEPERAEEAAESAAAEASRFEGEADARRRLERTWRERASQARDRLERAEAALLHWQRALVIGQGWQTDETGKRVMLSVRELQRRAARAEAEVQVAKDAIEELRAEARRASVPPGWLR